MANLDGLDAFTALTRLMENSDRGERWQEFSPSIERLRVALSENPQRASALDLAVLLRQALQCEHVGRTDSESWKIRVAHPRLDKFNAWERVGLRATTTNDGCYVAALPWRPSWLTQSDDFGVDAFAASGTICREFHSAGTEGDPFLTSVGRKSYRSRGQRSAVRAALSMPAGGALVVALPTGEGKSIIFQLIQSVGFVGANLDEERGVTVVIVPTVALGVNHEREAVDVCDLSKPLAFQGGNDIENETIAQRIADGSQGLCFASPEAACGRLREPLRRAAESGRLRAMVVDEAHLVDQWGTGFRTEFQELSGLRRELIRAAPSAKQMRTLFLSATLTDSSLQTLQTLFGIEGDFESIAAVQLRPEPDYWIAPITNEQARIDQIVESLHHVPRPAIIYVTEVPLANAWHSRLVGAGFQRVCKLHGKTSRVEREKIVSQWRDGLIDIVVGTSAFGLGIDYAHARSVIHACVPETLDRFYQEVGRGGRDGKSAFSLIVPTKKDFATARLINTRRVISIDRGLKRWTTMFERKLPLSNGRTVVRIDGRPGADERDIDMFGETNTDWNLRTVALMARAGLIRLLGTPFPRVRDDGDWLEIEIVEDHHLEKSLWKQHVEPIRQESRVANKRNLDLMTDYLRDARCPAEIFEELYGAHRLSRVCSRCRWCRADWACRSPKTPVGEPLAPWLIPLHQTLERLLDHNRRLLVTYDSEKLTRSTSRRLSESLQRLQTSQLSKLLIMGPQPFDMSVILKFAEKVPFFVSYVSSLALSRLPGGPELVLVGFNQRLEEQNLAIHASSPRIFVTARNQKAPNGRRLRDTFGGRTLTLEEFYAKVAQ